MTSDEPTVSVILAVLDEIAHIDAVLRSLQEQDLDEPYEVVVADGGSTDGTRERLAEWSQRWPAVRTVDNPQVRQSHGLNVAADAARGGVLVRADGHTLYEADYLRQNVTGLRGSDAVAVGGNLRPVGASPFGRAVAAVMTSPAAIGPAKFHHATEPTPADTVYLGCYRRADFLAVGGYRDLPSGVAEDADLYHRWRREGRTVLLVPAIRSTYRPRETVPSFWRQSLRYGAGKAELLWLEKRFPSWRPLAPLALVLGLLGGAALWGVSGVGWPLWLGAGAWLAVLLGVGAVELRGGAVHAARVTFAAGMMQLAYGLGLVLGLLRGPGQVAHLRSGAGSSQVRST